MPTVLVGTATPKHLRAHPPDMTVEDEGEETVRTWLVERDYDDRGLVSLVYATPDGERAVRREVSARMLSRNPTTAARDVPATALEPVAEADRERFRRETARVSENHAPDEEI